MDELFIGSAVCETVASAGLSVKVHRVGIHSYGESGSPEGLYEKYGLSTSGIKTSIQKFLQTL